jgi:diguanylate cyclase (GGDEF)-like protein
MDRPAFSCSLTAVLLHRVHRAGGSAAVAELLRTAGSPRTAEYLADLGNWVSYGEVIALWEAGAELTGDPQFARHIGEDFVGRLAGSGNSAVLRQLGSPEGLLRKIALAGHRFSTAADLEAGEVRPGYGEVLAAAADGFTRHRLHCEWTAGLLTQSTVLFGLAPARVEETSCQAEGAEHCRYVITWDADASDASDPAEEAASLRRQLDAMSARLQSMFDTAADLIASGDLDGTLARITERAALQVRAPHYLLAVQLTPESDPLRHSKGFSDAEAAEAARLVLSGAELPGHWLKVDVGSHLRHYGALLAVQKPGTTFFPHERDLLEVYARYAASALDTATALAEAQARQADAQRRYEESRTLLELARRLARAGSSEQVANRLADSIPGVVDCDRVAVYLWREERRELARVALTGGDDGGLEVVRADEVQQIADWVAHPNPEPFFIDIETSEVQGALRDLGAVAAVAVPIATTDRFLGCFVVSALEREERLRPSLELVDRLSGVAAHAVTALENGRLVDHITFQARHDQLTGATNRAGFHEVLTAATGREDASVALFYVDLDGFKPVNDDHGHDVGDALLCAVATRLGECVRGGDTVARLGGDEFAVVVSDVGGQEQLAAISRRLEHAFREPFSAAGREFRVGASIGSAVWNGESARTLLQRADAAMYAAKRSGCGTVVAA